MTGKQMCEYIAATMRLNGIPNADPEAIWNISPTGDLWPVFNLYWRARELNGDVITFERDGSVHANGLPMADSPEPEPREAGIV